jgi:hypothetical protein
MAGGVQTIWRQSLVSVIEFLLYQSLFIMGKGPLHARTFPPANRVFKLRPSGRAVANEPERPSSDRAEGGWRKDGPERRKVFQKEIGHSSSVGWVACVAKLVQCCGMVVEGQACESG